MLDVSKQILDYLKAIYNGLDVKVFEAKNPRIKPAERSLAQRDPKQNSVVYRIERSEYEGIGRSYNRAGVQHYASLFLFDVRLWMTGYTLAKEELNMIFETKCRLVKTTVFQYVRTDLNFNEPVLLTGKQYVDRFIKDFVIRYCYEHTEQTGYVDSCPIRLEVS